MSESKFYLSIGRHGRYGSDTPIEREDMLCGYWSGFMLKAVLPECETVYHSPLARAVTTARFQALGMGCSHILEVGELDEDTPSFTIRRFINNLLQNTDENVHWYHLVTHLPVAEKLGLPFLGAGDICLLIADSKEEMLQENFEIQMIKKQEIPLEIWQKIGLTAADLKLMSEDEIYQRLNR